MKAIRFTQRYAPEPLLADMEAAIAAARWVAKPEQGKYFHWSAIPLHAQHGALGLEGVHGHVPEWVAEECAPTPALAPCAHFRALLDAFPARKLRVRLMKLAVGGRIGRHRDRLYGWEQPILRLHVPSTTHPGVEFLLDGERIVMAPGELWYLDTTKDHEAHNPGPTDRVHLVMDLVNSPALREFLGPSTWDKTV